MTPLDEGDLDELARIVIQMLLRIQFCEDAAEILSAPGGRRRRARRLALLRGNYKASGLADVSLGEVGHVGRARGLR